MPHDVFTAVTATVKNNDISDLLSRMSSFGAVLETNDGRSLLAASKRALNILRIESKKDGPYVEPSDEKLFTCAEEHSLFATTENASRLIAEALRMRDYRSAAEGAMTLRAPLDQFFEAVKVNDPDPARRINRLRLLNRVNEVFSQIADFSQIQG